ncbi:MAG TPA: peptidoglycan DD-metalloendopeptidase family protein [Streptomyces sp.]|nr:peptidoglycan DD-metalloendopeptidase family protein [Streptomyces sp.]
MAVNGRHRRYQPNRINRASLTVTAGGAGIALPLIGAGTPAQAADAEARDTVTAEVAQQDHATGLHTADGHEEHGTASRATPAHKPAQVDVRPQTTPQSRAGRTEMYRVVPGDTLSGIAEEGEVDGGWQGLYAANRKTVGDDPDLILPGQRLSLRAGAAEAPAKPSATERSGTREDTRTKPGPSDKDKATDKAKTKSKGKPKDRAKDKAEDRGGNSAGDAAKESAEDTREEPRKAAPKDTHPKTSPERAERKAGSGHSGQSDRTSGSSRVAPVGAALGTPYHQAGSSWSKGYHTGVDFPVPTGTSVKAIAAGRVVSAGWGGSYGYEVVIRHDDGRYSQYGHLSAISVRAGQSVNVGQRIARSGSTGNSSGPHLHFEVRTGPGFGSDVDPLAYLRAGGVRI